MKQRNSTVDLIKLFSAFAVIAIHLSVILGQEDSFLFTGFRFAVPFFILTTGYYTKNKDNTINRFMKHYVFLVIIYLFPNIIFKGLFNYSVGFIRWYYPAILIMLVSLNTQNKKWIAFMFSLSIFFNVLAGHVGFGIHPTGSYEQYFTTNGAMTYLWLFVVGQYLTKVNFEDKSKILGVLIIVCSFLLSIINGLTWKLEQFMLFNHVLAITIFIGTQMATTNIKNPFPTWSFDMFIYHGIFLFIPQMIYPPIANYPVIYTLILSIISIICGSIMRRLNYNFLDNFFEL